MSAVTIPTDPELYFFTQTTTLDGVPYLLTFRFNDREQAYYLQIASADGFVTYAQGIKLVANYPLLMSFATPPGEMMAVSFAQDDSPPRIGELGDGLRCELLYFPQADVIAGGTETWRFPGPLGV